LPELQQRLRAGLAALDQAVAEPVQARLLAYVALLDKWNRHYNLTAVRDPAEMVSRHLLDSLALRPWLTPGALLDVGSGAGLPGIPLAIAEPERPVTVLDSNGKKTRFMDQVRRELSLSNLAVVQARVEQYRAPGEGFALITSRAFAALAVMAGACDHLLAPGGRLLAMKGRYPDEELRGLPKSFNVVACQPLAVPGGDGQRHLVIIERA
jgi:16S rRNA (guanine527-N7)-methyltransferase